MNLKNSLTLKPADIVIGELGYSDQSGFKRRPLVVVSSIPFNEKSRDVILVKISSKKLSVNSVSVLPNDVKQGNLLRDSYVDGSFLATIDRELLSDPIDSIQPAKMNQIKEKIKELLEL